MFIGGGVGRIGSIGAQGRASAAAPAPPPPPALPVFDTPSLLQASWWGTTAIDGADGVIVGGSTQDARFALVTVNRATGAIGDARITVDRPDLYGLPLASPPRPNNDHFYMSGWRIGTGPHAGKYIFFSCPHGPATSGIGSQLMFQFYSTDGRTQTVQPIGTGADAYVLFTATRNYCQLHEVTLTGGVLPQGTTLALIGNDGDQTWHLISTSDPAVKATVHRPIYAMTGIPTGGSTPQMYGLSTEHPDDPALQLDFMTLHPGVFSNSVKVASRNKQTGTVTSNGVTTPGCYDTTGAALMAWGDMTGIHAPLGAGIFQRFLSINRYGPYKGRAALFGRGTMASVNQCSHVMHWCGTGTSPESTWTEQAVGDTNRAQLWDSSSRYLNDAQFVPPLPGQTMRILLIATVAGGGQRIEEWASTSTPDAIVMTRASEVQTHTRWMRLFPNPKADAYNYQVMVTGHVPGSYVNYFNFTFAPNWHLTLGQTEILTAPQLTGPGAEGLPRSVTPSVALAFPAPTRTIARWELGDDLAGTNAATIAGMVGDGAVLPTGTAGKYHRAVELVNDIEVPTPWVGPIAAAPSLADIANSRSAILRPVVATPGLAVDGDNRATDWTSSGANSIALAQATSARRPLLISTPIVGLRFDQVRNDQLAGVLTGTGIDEFFAGVTAMLCIGDLYIDAAPNSATNRPLWLWSTQSGTAARFSLTLTQTLRLSASTRLSTEGAATKVMTDALETGRRYQVAHLAQLSATAGQPVQAIYVDGVLVASTGAEPAVGAATNATASQAVAVGNNTTVNGGLPGVLGPIVPVAKTSGNFSAEELAIAFAVHLAQR